MNPSERAAKLIKLFPTIYPDAHCELDFSNPLELLIATVLSAQCTDKRVNMVTPALFERCKTAQDYADISQEELETLIRSTGFYHTKATNIRKMAAAIVEHHHGKVPSKMGDLVALPGVGRKTANVVLGNAFHEADGIVVDTHVTRLAQRLGLTTQKNPLKIEADLMKLIPRCDWTMFAHWLIFHGRRRCFARRPDCAGCEFKTFCPSAGKV